MALKLKRCFFAHNFNRNTADVERLQMVRRIEQQQQKAVNWLIPAEKRKNGIEVTIGYEQVAVEWLARNEPDSYLRQVNEFGLLEGFDYLYCYANLMDLMGNGRKAEENTDNYTDITPGPPTIFEHRDPRIASRSSTL